MQQIRQTKINDQMPQVDRWEVFHYRVPNNQIPQFNLAPTDRPQIITVRQLLQ